MCGSREFCGYSVPVQSSVLDIMPPALWNTFPEEVRQIPTLYEFQHAVKIFSFQQASCECWGFLSRHFLIVNYFMYDTDPVFYFVVNHVEIRDCRLLINILNKSVKTCTNEILKNCIQEIITVVTNSLSIVSLL